MLSANEQKILSLLEEDAFMSQQEIADRMGLNRSTIANLISGLVTKKHLLGRAYIINRRSDIVCIGGLNMDRKYQISGKMMGQTSHPVTAALSVGGVARNIAENLGRLGRSVSLLTVAGMDHDYDWIRSQTESYVNLKQVTQLEGQVTSSYTAILDERGELQLGLADMGICDLMTPDWLASHNSLIQETKMIVADLNLPLETTTALIALARKNRLPLVLIPVSSPKMTHLPQRLVGVTFLIVNQDESETFFNCQVSSEEEFEALADKWLSCGVEQVLITRGKQPSLYANQLGKRLRLTPPAVEPVVDVTGAGDSFAAGLIYGLIQGLTPETSITYGQVNAYHTIQSADTVRKDLSADQLEQDVINLKEKGAI